VSSVNILFKNISQFVDQIVSHLSFKVNFILEANVLLRANFLRSYNTTEPKYN